MKEWMSYGLVIVLAISAVGAAPAAAQQSSEELRQEIEALKKGQAELLRELQEIKRLLQRRPAAAAGPSAVGAVLSLAGNPVQGDPSAPLTLVEFTDFQCGYCARHHRETYPKLIADYVDSGKLRYAVLDLPLERIHKLAMKAAEAAHCAGDQGKYWEMQDRLFEHQRALEPWSGHAAAVGLDVAAFDACLESGTHTAAVRRDMSEAGKVGATGTPSFVLARTDPQDPAKVTGLAFIRGAQPYAVFQGRIDEALEEQSD